MTKDRNALTLQAVGNRQLDTVSDIAQAFEKNADGVIDLLDSGQLEEWLAKKGHKDIQQLLSDIRKSEGDNETKTARVALLLNTYVEHRDTIDFFKKIVADSKRFTFFVTGVSGVGKSSTINSLLGYPAAHTSAIDIGTVKIDFYDGTINGIEFRIADSPGFADGSGQDTKYADRIRREIPDFHCMWFVTRIDQHRILNDEKETIKVISRELGSAIWKHAILVFTHADKLDSDDFESILKAKSVRIQQEIATYTGVEIANEIPYVAVANDSKTNRPKALPNGRPWLGELYVKTLKRITKKAVFSFFLATADRLSTSEQTNRLSPEKIVSSVPIDISPEQKKEIRNVLERKIDANIIIGLTTAGAGAGAALGPLGALLGAAGGAALGTVVWFFSK